MWLRGGARIHVHLQQKYERQADTHAGDVGNKMKRKHGAAKNFDTKVSSIILTAWPLGWQEKSGLLRVGLVCFFRCL